MPKTKLNPILEEVRGTLDGVTFRRMYGKQVIMKKPDMSNVKWSKAQRGHRQRFQQAVAYARAALADARVRMKYEKAAAKAGKASLRLGGL